MPSLGTATITSAPLSATIISFDSGVDQMAIVSGRSDLSRNAILSVPSEPIEITLPCATLDDPTVATNAFLSGASPDTDTGNSRPLRTLPVQSISRRLDPSSTPPKATY